MTERIKVRALALALLVTGCDGIVSGDRRADEMRHVQYWHDVEGDVCFAEYDLNRNYGHFVYVPCTPGVVAQARRLREQGR